MEIRSGWRSDCQEVASVPAEGAEDGRTRRLALNPVPLLRLALDLLIQKIVIVPKKQQNLVAKGLSLAISYAQTVSMPWRQAGQSVQPPAHA